MFPIILQASLLSVDSLCVNWMIYSVCNREWVWEAEMTLMLQEHTFIEYNTVAAFLLYSFLSFLLFHFL